MSNNSSTSALLAVANTPSTLQTTARSTQTAANTSAPTSVSAQHLRQLSNLASHPSHPVRTAAASSLRRVVDPRA